MQETAESAQARSDVGPAPRRNFFGRRAMTAGVALFLLIALPFVASMSLPQHTESAAPPSNEEQRVVRVAKPGRSEIATLTLPGNVDAYQSALLHSRVNGYLVRLDAEIGDRVKKGQALAEIDTPELDQEYQQAQANLVQGRADHGTALAELQEAKANLKQAEAGVARARASLKLAQSVLRREEQLYAKHAIADQELDERRCDQETRQADLESAEAVCRTRESSIATCTAKVESRKATVSSLEANVRRLEELQRFKTIRAPFDGVVARRRAEIGILVTAGSATMSQELFSVVQPDTLRIRVSVPQAEAMAVQKGQTAQVLTPEYPNRAFAAKVMRTSQAIDLVSRTLMVELELPNADQALLPGTFAQVVLPLRRTEPICTVPGAVLLSRTDGIKVAVVDGQGAIRLRDVKLGRDYGSTVEVLGGLQGNETLVLNPRDDIAEDEKVTIADAHDKAPPPSPPSVAGRAAKTLGP